MTDPEEIVAQEHAREDEIAAERERIGTTRGGQPIESVKHPDGPDSVNDLDQRVD